MRNIFILVAAIFLSSCSQNHEINIPSQPCLFPYKDYDFSLCQDFYFEVNNDMKKVPKGFITDLASVPRVLWSIYSPSKADTIAGAIIHDYLYLCPNGITRQEADSIFYDALVLQGVSSYTSYKYWTAVRLFGSSHYHNGAICTHDYTRTEDTISNNSMA